MRKALSLALALLPFLAHAQGSFIGVAAGSGGGASPPPPPPPEDFCEDTFTADTGSRTDVLAAIALADAGDCVISPPDSESWAGGITISGISLIGAGKDAGSPSVVTAGTVTVTKHATDVTRLIGFRFTGTDQPLIVGGTVTNEMVVVHGNYFEDDGSGTFLTFGTNGSLFSENEVVATTPHGADTIHATLGASAGDDDWDLATTFGDDDTDGDRNNYFEDNTYLNFLEIIVDCDDGSRVVVRYNTLTDSSITAHAGGSGGSGNDTSLVGCRQLEIYGNTFVRVSNAVPINKWVWYRGTSGVFYDNVVPRADSPDGTSYGGKPEIRLGVGCGNGGYPRQFQVGQSTKTEDATPDQPLYIAENTGAGTSDGNFISVGENNTGGGGATECPNPEDFIQEGRDYVLTNTWGWAPFTYPHPLHPEIDGSGDL